jgi:hypothetical protein
MHDWKQSRYAVGFVMVEAGAGAGAAGTEAAGTEAEGGPELAEDPGAAFATGF